MMKPVDWGEMRVDLNVNVGDHASFRMLGTSVISGRHDGVLA